MLHNIFMYYLYTFLDKKKHFFNHNKIWKLGSCVIGKCLDLHFVKMFYMVFNF